MLTFLLLLLFSNSLATTLYLLELELENSKGDSDLSSSSDILL
jgi:hypothetical protein